MDYKPSGQQIFHLQEDSKGRRKRLLTAALGGKAADSRAQLSSSPMTFLSNYQTLRSIIMLISCLVVVEKCN